MQSPSVIISPVLDSQVQTPTTTVSEEETKDILSLSFTTPLSQLHADVKDLREYEHDRKHTKKAQEYKTRKLSLWRRSLRPEVRVTGGMGKDSLNPVSSEDCVVHPELTSRPVPATTPHSFTYSSATARPEVKLTDLVTSKKPRKGKHDFEIIPHVRSVIVLDDFAEYPRMLAEEPWEYIDSSSDSDTGSTTKAVTYAAVLST